MLVYIKFLSNMWDFFFLKKKRTMWNSGLPTILVNPYLLGSWATKFHHLIDSSPSNILNSLAAALTLPGLGGGVFGGVGKLQSWSCWETQLVLSERKKTGHNWDILLEGSIDYPFPPTVMDVKHGVLEDVWLVSKMGYFTLPYIMGGRV